MLIILNMSLFMNYKLSAEATTLFNCSAKLFIFANFNYQCYGSAHNSNVPVQQSNLSFFFKDGHINGHLLKLSKFKPVEDLGRASTELSSHWALTWSVAVIHPYLQQMRIHIPLWPVCLKKATIKDATKFEEGIVIQIALCLVCLTVETFLF